MRKISWLFVGIGWALIASHATSFAQDAPRPPVQVVIGPGGIKVIDPRTGKEVPSVVTKLPEKKQDALRVLQIEIDLQPELALQKELMRALLLQQPKDKDKIEIKQLEFKIVPGPDGKNKILIVQPRPPEPLSADKKLDLLLKHVDELRKEVDGIKTKLDGKGPPAVEWRFQWGGGKGPPVPPLPPGADKKLDKVTAENLKAIVEALRKYQDQPSYGKLLEDEAIKRLKLYMEAMDKKEAKKQTDSATEKQKPANRQAEIDRRLERILREAEELRREIREMQTPKKK